MQAPSYQRAEHARPESGRLFGRRHAYAHTAGSLGQPSTHVARPERDIDADERASHS